MLKGFRQFIARGNIVDLASAVILGVAFGVIVDSLVKDVITPILGMLGGQPDFSAVKIGPVAIGNFINAIIGFVIKAASVYFLVVLPFNRFATRLAAAPPPPAPPTQSELYLKEIRDLLARRPA
jgi:large conductance mechanosensitive channel